MFIIAQLQSALPEVLVIATIFVSSLNGMSNGPWPTGTSSRSKSIKLWVNAWLCMVAELTSMKTLLLCLNQKLKGLRLHQQCWHSLSSVYNFEEDDWKPVSPSLGQPGASPLATKMAPNRRSIYGIWICHLHTFFEFHKTGTAKYVFNAMKTAESEEPWKFTLQHV